MEVDFDQNKYLRAYRELMDAVGIGSGNMGNSVTLADYKSSNFILPLDLTADFCSEYFILSEKENMNVFL